MSEALRLADSLLYNVSIFNMFRDVNNSRVEDVAQSVFSEVFLRYYSEHFGVGVL